MTSIENPVPDLRLDIPIDRIVIQDALSALYRGIDFETVYGEPDYLRTVVDRTRLHFGEFPEGSSERRFLDRKVYSRAVSSVLAITEPDKTSYTSIDQQYGRLRKAVLQWWDREE